MRVFDRRRVGWATTLWVIEMSVKSVTDEMTFTSLTRTSSRSVYVWKVNVTYGDIDVTCKQ